MWTRVLQDPNEQQAFTTLLDDYFSRPPPHHSHTSPNTPCVNAPAPAALPPRSVPPAPAPRASAPAPAHSPALPKLKHERPRPPAGLTSSKTTAGGFDASSKRSFAKGVFSSKGPMNRAEMEKEKNVGPLFVKSSTGAKPQPPPPRRTGAAGPAAGAQEERVRALYDYEGAEAEDLPLREGEELVVVEHVSSDWIRCRNASGSSGLVPAAYVQPL
ncbi:hypothetical protein JCM6882_001716 [Rhodosporidiobolus microsporus]